MKPLRFPGDKLPVQNITICPECGGAISEKDPVPFCTNCNKTVDGKKGNPFPGKVPQKGERYKDFGPKDTVLPQGFNLQRVAQSKDHLKRNKKDKDFAEHDPDTVKEVFTSDPIHQCLDLKKKNRRFDDVKKEEIMRSCEDLAIDG